jgi:hypothetical protein
LVGRPEDGEDVRVGPFLRKIDAMRDSLRATDRVISQGEQLFDYLIVGLSHSSPSTIEIEPVPLEMEALDKRESFLDTYYTTLVGIQETGTIPSGFGYADLQSFKRLEPQEQTIPEVIISRNGDEVRLAGDWAAKVDTILGPDRYAIGSATGMLQQINVHGKNQKFTIYPTFGEPELRCRFDKRDSELRGKVVRAIDRYVRVFGTLHYKAGSWHPHAIDITDITAFPPESELPTLDDLFGIAPGATGDDSVEDFVRKVRDGWE